MKKVDNSIRFDVDRIKGMCVVKTLKGKKYYYIKRAKEGPKYLCPINVSNKELTDYYCLFISKIYDDLLEKIYLAMNKFESQHITDFINANLSILWMASQLDSKDFLKTDLKSYEEAIFTKYVYGTTSIEGNTFSLRETSMTLNEGLTVGGKSLRESHEIENYKSLKEYIDNLNLSEKTITTCFIKKIHSFILNNINNNQKGDYRNIQVYVKGSEFEPTQPIFIEDEMNELVKWYHDNRNKMHDIELFSIFHHKFERIHPFFDGNGRVGREILRIMLKIEGFPTIFIDNSTREEYLNALGHADKGDYNYIVKFIIKNLLDVHKSLIENIKTTLDEESYQNYCDSCSIKKKCDKNKEKMTIYEAFKIPK